jgi:hypothetical protein
MSRPAAVFRVLVAQALLPVSVAGAPGVQRTGKSAYATIREASR